MRSPGSSWSISFHRYVSRSITCAAADQLSSQGQEARFFSLFSITDKSASFLGPAAIACVADWTGEIRYGFGVLALLMIAPVPILRYCVIQERGRRDARDYVR